MATLYVVGIGPGAPEHFTTKAIETIKQCDVVVGYNYYIKLVSALIEGKKIIKTGMRSEIERCELAIAEVKKGSDTCIISTGDAGLYGMAGPISAAAELGAPLMHDFCTISLSDLLTPWEVIEKRLDMAARGDFVISLYNPKSKGRLTHIEKAVAIISKHFNAERPVALVKNAGREGNKRKLVRLEAMDYEFIDMKTIVIVGNSRTIIKNGNMITPRGYKI